MPIASIASIVSIIELGTKLISSAKVALDLGKNVAPWIKLLSELFGGKKLTAEEVAAIRKRADELDAKIEALPDED